MKRNLLILFSVLWILFGIWYYTTVTSGHMSRKTTTDSDSTAMTTDSSGNTGLRIVPLSFNFNESNPIKGQGYDDWVDSLSLEMGDKDTLRIIGLYYSGEENGELIATSRSLATQRLLSGNLDKTRMVVDFSEEMQPAPDALSVHGIRFELRKLKINQEKTSEGIIIPFMKNSLRRVDDNLYNKQLHDLATKVKSLKDFSIDVVGHTSQGTNPDNDYDLGRKRAWSVKKFLMDSGVDPARIITDSKGSGEPVQDDVNNPVNDRVEVILNLNTNGHE